MAKKSLLPVIFGMDPPTKEVILTRGERGYDCFVNYARFPEGTTQGQEFSFSDEGVRREGGACWLHFCNKESLRRFGQMLSDFAGKEE